MSRMGLALSGGGYRATLYHLGVLRFLRDSGLLPRVSHITSVSGGSIMAAHLVTNWNRYSGSEKEFDQAAAELLNFIRRDVRNRVVRRFPLAFVANLGHWAVGRGWSRRLTRPGLLEAHYEQFLYGDKCLYELPTTPQLHMLATNVNEGCLCSFTRSGLLVERRTPQGSTYFASIPSALATIPMAVAASSAFPGFFPPLQLTARDVGADEGRFPPHVLTDGGVYDNLGVRMFRHIQDSWIGHDTPLVAYDFVDLADATTELNRALVDSDNNGSLSRLAHHIVRRNAAADQGSIAEKDLPNALWNVIVYDQLYLDPEWGLLDLPHEQAAELLRLVRGGRELERGDHLWLNRCLVNAIAESAGIGRLLQTTETRFDTVIVSDAGKEFHISRKTSGGGLIGTAIRSSDILMDRVWKLEVDHFGTNPDFVFVPISGMVDLSEDPTALHPELQRQVAVMRTDLDRFSDLEISGLVRHGYGLIRKICRSRPDLFGEDLPSNPPWDPTRISDASESSESTSLITKQARQLQGSTQRRVLGHLLDLRDWPSYVYITLLALLLIGVPWLGYRSYRLANRSEMIVNAITFSNPDFQTVMQLARRNPLPGDWTTVPPETVAQLGSIDTDQFVLVTDTRILDMRGWKSGVPTNEQKMVSYRRMRVARKEGSNDVAAGQPSSDGKFRFRQRRPDASVAIRCDAERLSPRFRIASELGTNGEEEFVAEAEFDLSRVPEGEAVDIGFEVVSSGIQGRMDNLPYVEFPIVGTTNVATMWVLLPENRPYERFEVFAYEKTTGRLIEAVEPTYTFNMKDGSLFGWMLIDPKMDHNYECRWTYRGD